MSRILLLFLSCCLLVPSHASNRPWVSETLPQDVEKTWWDDAWWQQGQMVTPANHPVRMERVEFTGDQGIQIPALLLRPDDDARYPAVLFVHGRRGLDEFTSLVPRRLAARGFVVLAPDLFSGRFIEPFPLEHNYQIEADAALGLDTLLAREDISTSRACVVSHTRGGYISVKALISHQRQDGAACYLSYYPHWQDPNLPEPYQVYQYAPELDQLTLPTLIFVGEDEQYQRLRPITTAIEQQQKKGRDAQLIVYPGVGRGFDFRPPNVRTFADDLASRDAMQRSADFINRHLLPFRTP